MKPYLALYNLASAAGWLYVLVTMISGFQKHAKSYEQNDLNYAAAMTWEEVGTVLIIVQR